MLSFWSFQSKFMGDTETFFLGFCWRNPFDWINIPKKVLESSFSSSMFHKGFKVTNFDIFERNMKLTPMWQSRSTGHILWSRGKCLQSPSQKTCRKDIFIENDNDKISNDVWSFSRIAPLDLVHWLHFCTNGYDPVLL